jgi:hypothetical protein
MKQRCFVFFAVIGLFFSGCAIQQPALVSAAKPQLKRITQLDVTTNLPVKSWNARGDSIHQHVTPPVGISFIDAETGKKVHFEGTYKVESYRDSNGTMQSNESHPSKVKATSDDSH